MLLYRLARKFDENGLPYAIVGGYAVALHGVTRGTLDIDIVIKIVKKDFLKVEEILSSMGFESRLPVKAEQIFNFRDDYIKNRNLVAWNFYNPKKPSEIIDIIITHDLNKMNSVAIYSGGVTLKVLSLSSLIKMKKESARPQDLEDVRALEDRKNEKK